MIDNKKLSPIYEIEFGTKLFDALICLDANLPSNDFYTQFDNIPILAADGAAIRLYEIGISADYIVGDLDTFYGNPLSKNIKEGTISHKPDQESNDFEKILVFAREKGFETLLITGFHGGELEHTLNNWSVFKRYADLLNLCIFDKGRYGIPMSESFSLKTLPGEIISLIPQAEAVVSTKNLKWKLENEKLELGFREGARNRAAAGSISVEIHSGSLLVFCDERTPYAPMKLLSYDKIK